MSRACSTEYSFTGFWQQGALTPVTTEIRTWEHRAPIQALKVHGSRAPQCLCCRAILGTLEGRVCQGYYSDTSELGRGARSCPEALLGRASGDQLWGSGDGPLPGIIAMITRPFVIIAMIPRSGPEYGPKMGGGSRYQKQAHTSKRSRQVRHPRSAQRRCLP